MVEHNIVLQQNDAQQWCMSVDANASVCPPTPYPQLPVPKNDTGTFKFLIERGSNFSTKAISVENGHKKPGHPGVANGQITVTKLDASNLWFTDSNNLHAKNDLTYVLYFQDGSTLDPIISNGGCCTRTYLNYVWYAAGIVALIAIIVLAVRMRQNKAP